MRRLRNRRSRWPLLGYRTDHFDHVIKEVSYDLHIFHRFKRWIRCTMPTTSAVYRRMAKAVIIPNTDRMRDLYKLINARRSGALVICKDSAKARGMAVMERCNAATST